MNARSKARMPRRRSGCVRAGAARCQRAGRWLATLRHRPPSPAAPPRCAGRCPCGLDRAEEAVENAEWLLDPIGDHTVPRPRVGSGAWRFNDRILRERCGGTRRTSRRAPCRWGTARRTPLPRVAASARLRVRPQRHRARPVESVCGREERGSLGAIVRTFMRRERSGEMIFTQYYLGCLSHASYLDRRRDDRAGGRRRSPARRRGSTSTTPPRDGLTIERVIETHFHADFLSGHLELAARDRRRRSATARPPTPSSRSSRSHDGERLELGEVDARDPRTRPGHTPESICVVVYEHADDAEPYGVLTGDTLFIGDVGRPDLLASIGRRPPTSWPACSTDSLHEQAADAARRDPRVPGPRRRVGVRQEPVDRDELDDRRAAAHELRARADERGRVRRGRHRGPAAAPPYFAFDARSATAKAHALLDEPTRRRRSTIDEVLARRDAGAVRARHPRAGRVRRRAPRAASINVGLDGPLRRVGRRRRRARTAPIVLVADPALERRGQGPARPHRLRPRRRPALDRRAAVRRAPRADRDAASRLDRRRSSPSGGGLEPTLQLVDVRKPGETAAGTIAGRRRRSRCPSCSTVLGELDPRRPTVVYCAGGYRSSIAASVLRAAGFADVSDLLGGYGAWRAMRAGG